jgi:leader peptidase (prepilin peptidase)/N-methyltransferase
MATLTESQAPLAVLAAVLAFLAYLYLAAVSVALAAIDVGQHRLPNAIVLPSYAVGVLLLGLAAVLAADWAQLARTIVSGLLLFAFYLVLALISPRGMGFGDVKLAGALGLFLGFAGWGTLVIGALAPFLLGGAFALFLLVARRADRKTSVPFGPWMLLGAWIAILWGEGLSRWYLAQFGLI